MGSRCHLCTANDRDAVIDRVAGAMWESRRHGTLDDRPWPEAFPYWRQTYIELATAAVDALDQGHAVR
ncbi:hypothetical protein [Sphingomonas sp. GC_Shp_6]|nr:hypothetical protein [Sphingomonas sp. GC_Shp_6]